MLQWSRRTQMSLWLAAVVVSLVPAALGVVSWLRRAETKRIGIGFTLPPDQCGGWFHQMDVLSIPGFQTVIGAPYLVVVPAFVMWVVTRWRAAGWVAVAILGPVALVHPVMFGYDAARWGRTCVDLWLLPWPGWQVAWWAGRLVLLALLVAVVYRPGARVVRTVSGVLAMGLVLGIAGDQEPPRVVMANPDDCKKVRPATPADSGTLLRRVQRLSEDDRRLAYLCSVRGYPERQLFRRYPAPEDPLTDGVLLHLGQRACRGDKPISPRELGRRGTHWPSVGEMAYLCPETAAVELRKRERKRAELQARYKREKAIERAYCKRTVPQGPRPVREATAVAWGGESGSYSVGPGGGPFDEALDDGLVASDGETATVITGTQGGLCLTVRAYRKAPPLDLKGWEQVAEVGFESPDGRSKVGSMDGPPQLPAVTAAGPGSYRLRVYVSGHDKPETYFPEMPAERHLLVVYPGNSKKHKVFKSAER